MSDKHPRRPAVQNDDGRVHIDVALEDAEELQIHLRSLGIGTAIRSARRGTARLEVLDHGAEETDAAVGEWEVARAAVPG